LVGDTDASDVGILGHEATHILQGDHYSRADDIMGWKRADSRLQIHRRPVHRRLICQTLAASCTIPLIAATGYRFFSQTGLTDLCVLGVYSFSENF